MITKDDILKAAEICTMGGDHGELCPNCPLDNEKAACALIFAEYIKENEPTPAATGTSSEVSKDTDNIHLDDSTLLDICQEELEAISEIALNDYPNEYLTGYIVALKKNIERLRGGHSD
jgi:hypothetical protein